MASTPDMNNPQPLPVDPAAISALTQAPATPAQQTQPAATQPTTPATPATVPSVYPAQPNAPNSGQPNTPATSQPSPHARLFDRILQTMSGGPVRTMVTDPQTGDSRVVEQPQSRTQMGKSIVAAVLAGMMTPNHYAPGPGGAERPEGSADAAAAFNAGAATREATDAKAQSLADEALSRKLLTAKNNISAMRQYAALAHEQHQDLDETVAINKPMLDDAVEHDKNLDGTDPSQKAILAQGLTWSAAMEDPSLKGKLTQNNLVVSGSTTTFDPKTGQEKVVPTYTILNPDAKLTLSKDTVDVLSKINPQYAKAYDLTSGNVQLNVRSAIKASHDAANVSTAEDYFERAAAELGTAEKQDLFSAVRNSQNRQQLMNAIDMMHTAMASASPLYRTLDAIRQVPGSEELFKAIGLDGQQVDKYINTQVNEVKRQQVLAAEGGMGPKAPAPKEMVDSLIQSVNGSALPPETKKTLLAGVPETHGGQSTMQQAEDMRNRILTAQQAQIKDNLQNGDPDELAKTAKNVIASGDITAPKDLFTARSNVREKANNLFQDQARALGLQPNHFTVEALKTKAAAFEDYSGDKKGSTGAQLTAFKTFGEHIASAKDANDAWQRSGSPDLNKTMSWWAQHGSNDQSYQAFKASLIAPMKEYMNVLNAGHAEHTEDLNKMAELIEAGNITPQTAYTMFQTFAKTADERVKALGETYRDTVGDTFPALISKATVDNFSKLGVKSQAAALSGQLPRAQSWVNSLQPQTISLSTPEGQAIAQRFKDAAGGDSAKAQEMALEHGYVLSH